MRLTFYARFIFLLAAVVLPFSNTQAEDSPVNQRLAMDDPNQKAHVSVFSQGLKDYVGEIIRIESVHDSNGNAIYKRGLIGKYLKSISLDAPNRYTLKVLCERWYLLEFKHPTIEVSVDAGQRYQVSCERTAGQVSANIVLLSGS